jgi:hypothetical protein
MTVINQLSDKELSEALNFHRRQRNLSRGVNESHHMRQTQMVRMLEAEEARRLEEAEQLDEIGDTAKGRKALKAVIARAPEKAANARLRSDLLGRRQFDPDVSHKDSELYGKASEKHYRKYQLAVKGAARAVDRLTKEEVELDEVSDKKLDAYRQKAFADQPAGDDGSDKYRKRKFGRDLAFSKQTGRAKVLATKEEVDLDEGKNLTDTKSDWRSDKSATAKNWSHNKLMKAAKHDRSVEKEIKRRIASKEYVFSKEEVELDEASDLRITKVYNKFPKKATYAVHSSDRKYYKEFDSMEKAKAHHAEKTGK